MRKNEDITERFAAQFKIGRTVLKKIDGKCQKENVSRNHWMHTAVIQYIERGEAVPYAITAEDLLTRKHTVMLRLDSLTLGLISEYCHEKKIPRTVFLLDAFLSRLASERKVKSKRN